MLKEKFVNFMFLSFLFILFFVGLFTGNLHIKASMNIGSNSGWSSIDCTCPTTGICNTCTGSISTGKINFGTSSNTSGQGLTYKTNNLFYATYSANYTYTISFRTHFGGLGNKLNLVKEQVQSNKWSFWIAGFNNDNVGFSDSYITSASCSTRFDNTTSNGFITTCNIGVNTNLTRLRIEVNYFNNNSSSVSYYSDIYSPTSMRVDFLNMEETQGIDATINNSTNNIINNNNQNTQNIIDNQNNTTQQIIDNQNEMLGNKCENMFNNENITPNTTFDSSGNTFSANGFFLGNEYIPVEPNTTYSLDSYNGYRVVEYTSSHGFIQRLFDVKSFTTSANTRYIRLSGNTNNLINVMLVKGSTSKPYCKYGSYSSKLDETKNAINNLNDNINDDDVENPSSFLEDMADLMPQNGVITNLLTLPIQLFQKVLSSINGTCQSFNLGNLYGTNLIMPCIEVSNYLGSTLWNTIDLIISGVFVLTIAKKMIKAFENFTGMKEGDVIND